MIGLLSHPSLQYRNRETYMVLYINPFDEEEICVEMKYKPVCDDYYDISDHYLIGVNNDGLLCFTDIGTEIDGIDKNHNSSLKIIGIDNV